MSTYGLRVKDASGNIVLDTIDEISRFRYSNVVAAGVSDSVVLSDISGLSSVEFSVALEEGKYKSSHIVNRSGTTISWTAQSGNYYSSTQSLIFLFLYT